MSSVSSTTTTTTNWLITGASRGLGFALTERLASTRPDVLIFATARNPSTATALQTLSSKHPNVHVLKLEGTSSDDARSVASEVDRITSGSDGLGGGGLDVVVANAGVYTKSPVASLVPEDLYDLVKVNVGGPLIAFQAFWPLLKERKTRKFVVVSSSAGSLELAAGNYPGGTAYGTSKAAANFVVKSINGEHKDEGIVAWAQHPGWVQTEMGNTGAQGFGLKEAPQTIDESITGMLEVFDGATQETVGGAFIDYLGKPVPW
ncbi:hypothetical protein HKX48_000002 [Thoreauomyces humboldtii]|nr:hypothetical protein HKX48_000002 [Thoreauomyces humboldtii]